jgi:peptide/nickel transport system ATP-binding protein
MQTLLTVKDLTISYDGQTPSLRGVDISIDRKEILGIVGESGSGKTTLIRSLINLLPANTAITAQTMRFNGKDLPALSKEQWRRLRGNEIGMIFQNPGAYLNPNLKIGRQFVESIRNKQPLSKKEAQSKAIQTLEKMHLDDPQRIMHAYPFQLSGGMQQRVAIAMTMVMDPLLILADEPTSALDVKTQAQIVRELVSLREKFDTSIIMVTHNICCSAHTADRLMVMRKGRVVECDRTTRVLKDPQQAYTRRLLAAIPILKGAKSSPLMGELSEGWATKTAEAVR